jgi:alkylation response protein AidB-like acyl-CoA dehydrogenase
MPSSLPSGPAFARVPPWVLTKLSPTAIAKIEAVYDFVETECIPAEPIMKAQIAEVGKRWTTQPLMHELREKAKAKGLFNLFLPKHFKESPGLTNLEYACCAELMGRVYWAQQV